MYPMYRFTEEPPLHKDDVNGIQYLYGEALGQGWEEEGKGRGCATVPKNWGLGDVGPQRLYGNRAWAQSLPCQCLEMVIKRL